MRFKLFVTLILGFGLLGSASASASLCERLSQGIEKVRKIVESRMDASSPHFKVRDLATEVFIERLSVKVIDSSDSLWLIEVWEAEILLGSMRLRKVQAAELADLVGMPGAGAALWIDAISSVDPGSSSMRFRRARYYARQKLVSVAIELAERLKIQKILGHVAIQAPSEEGLDALAYVKQLQAREAAIQRNGWAPIGLVADPSLSFHLGMGAKVLSIADEPSEASDSGQNVVTIVYDL